MNSVALSRASTPLGNVILAGDDTGLMGLWFEGQKHEGVLSDSRPRKEAELPVFNQTWEWLARYFEGRDPGPLPPIILSDTPFRMCVWGLLRQIPRGELVTYGELARKAAALLGKPMVSARAVGNAVGRNPISILIPCHRVVGSGQKLTGYAGGLDRKQALLQLERSLPNPALSTRKKQPESLNAGR